MQTHNGVGGRIFVVSPDSAGIRLEVLNSIAQDPTTVYVRLEGWEIGYEDIDKQILRALSNNVIGSSQSADVCTIVLDEFDRVKPRALCQYLRKAMQSSGAERVFYLMGRGCSSTLTEDPVCKSKTVFLPETPVYHATRAGVPNRHHLVVEAFGKGRVFIDGRLIETWGGIGPELLLHYLVSRGMVPRADIFATFWSHLSQRDATNVFHVTKRKIKERLGGVELTVYSDGFYRISPEIDMHYDVEHFRRLLQQSDMGSSNEQAALLDQAKQLVKGRFLANHSAGWIKAKRRHLDEQISEMYFTRANLYYLEGELWHALGAFIRSFAFDDTQEDAAEKVMSIYLELNQPCDALKVYQRVHAALLRELGVPPRQALRDLAAKAHQHCPQLP